jgi:hypothetical protein
MVASNGGFDQLPCSTTASAPKSELQIGDDQSAGAGLVWSHVSTGATYQDTNIKVMAVENTHFAFHKNAAAGEHKSYPYRFEIPALLTSRAEG